MNTQEPALDYLDALIDTRGFITSIAKEDVQRARERQEQMSTEEYVEEDRKSDITGTYRASVINLKLSELYLAELQAKRRLVEKCLRAGHLQLSVQL